MSLQRSPDFLWQWCRFSELATKDLYAVVRLREAVFIVEQNCPYPDADGRDPKAWHLLGWIQGKTERTLVAYARIFEPGVRYNEGSIGRVVTVGLGRGRGLGREVMVRAIAHAAAVWPGTAIRISAQTRLERFYASLDFVAVGPPYLEDGIDHTEMLLAAKPV